MSLWWEEVDDGASVRPTSRTVRWKNRWQRRTHRGDGLITISTVFLAIDHSLGTSPPILYETMVFTVNADDIQTDVFCGRYPSRADAEAGHDEVVAAIDKAVAAGEDWIKAIGGYAPWTEDEVTATPGPAIP